MALELRTGMLNRYSILERKVHPPVFPMPTLFLAAPGGSFTEDVCEKDWDTIQEVLCMSDLDGFVCFNADEAMEIIREFFAANSSSSRCRIVFVGQGVTPDDAEDLSHLTRPRFDERLRDEDDSRVWRFEDGSTVAFERLADAVAAHPSPFAVDVVSDAPNSYRWINRVRDFNRRQASRRLQALRRRPRLHDLGTFRDRGADHRFRGGLAPESADPGAAFSVVVGAGFREGRIINFYCPRRSDVVSVGGGGVGTPIGFSPIEPSPYSLMSHGLYPNSDALPGNPWSGAVYRSRLIADLWVPLDSLASRTHRSPGNANPFFNSLSGSVALQEWAFYHFV